MTQFSDLKLDPKVLQAIAEAGYTTPTPIQAGAIPPALEGRDVLGIAQTGTGKTASFTLPMITLLSKGRARARMPRSLVLCPTRELAAQVSENFEIYAKHTRLTMALLIGGVSMKDQEKLIDRGVDVLIATPGRLLDHFERGNLLLQGVQIMVVDEADRMLDMGFIPDIERIFQLTPFTRQTLFFSATMAPEIERITDTFLHAPERIEVARQASASETITQRLVEITPTRKDQAAKQKRDLLRAVIEAEGAALKNAIIFCNRKTEVDIVAKSLKAHGYDAAPIHGDLEQAQRTRTLDGFREGTLRFLIASDVAARGLDIPAVSHVFNFDLPTHAEDYVHRIGRTGRAGLEGTAISLAVPADEKYLLAIESLLKQSLPRSAAPQGFAPGEGSSDEPRAAREGERPGRSTSRTRSRGGRSREDRPRDDQPREDAVAQTSTETAAPTPAEPQTQAPARAEPRRDSRNADADNRTDAPRNGNRREGRDRRDDPRTESRRDDGRRDDGRRDDGRRDDGRRDEAKRDDHRRDDKGRDDKGRDDRRGGRDDRRPSVTGMGDHMPDFLMRSFRTNLPPIVETAADSRTEGEALSGADQRAGDTQTSPNNNGEHRSERRSGRSRSRRGGRDRDRDDRNREARADDAQGSAATDRGATQPAADTIAAAGVVDVPAVMTSPEAALPEAAPALEAMALPDADPAPVPQPVPAASDATSDETTAKPRRRSRAAKIAPEAAPAGPDAAATTDEGTATDAAAKPRRKPAKPRVKKAADATPEDGKADAASAAVEADSDVNASSAKASTGRTRRKVARDGTPATDDAAAETATPADKPKAARKPRTKAAAKPKAAVQTEPADKAGAGSAGEDDAPADGAA